MAAKRKRPAAGNAAGRPRPAARAASGRPGPTGARPASAARAPSRPAATPEQFRADAYRSVRENMAAAKPRRRRWDLVLSIVLCLLLGVVCVSLSYLGAVLSVFPASCETQNIACDFERINWGVTLALLGPAFATLIAVGITIVRYLFGRLAFWVPLVGVGVCIAIAFAASALVTSGIPGAALA